MLRIGSVTQLIPGLMNGDSRAQQEVWQRYVNQLVQRARGRLGNLNDGVKHEEVAAEALASFCRGVERGRFPKLNDRSDLWQILVMLARNKIVDEARRRKRRREVLECDLDSPENESVDLGLAQFDGEEPTPEFAASVMEQYERVLEILGDEQLKQIAQLKVECYTEAEIAEKTGLALRTLQRRLSLIRRIWEAAAEEAAAP